MNQDPKQAILQVLDAIGYENDKEKFVDEFLVLCLQKALTNLMEKLPQDKQYQLIHKMSLTPPEKKQNILSEYFQKDKFDSAVKEASQSTFEDYLKTIIPTLKDDQKNKLEQILSSKSQAASV